MTSTQLATRFDAPPRAATPQTVPTAPTALPPAADERRVLVAVRWPVGGIRTHILYNYPTAAENGYRFTFVGPADETFERFAASMACLSDPEFVGVGCSGPAAACGVRWTGCLAQSA